ETNDILGRRPSCYKTRPTYATKSATNFPVMNCLDKSTFTIPIGIRTERRISLASKRLTEIG
ncbi:MAG: hypothetical protein ACYC3I_21655, partial [Gemmataceae bacterium]